MQGPSGVGKSTVSSLICKNYNYKHCDADEFKWLFSHERSKERTAIGEYIAYIYAVELIKHRHNIVIEAIPNKYLRKLIPLLRKNNYTAVRILLQAPVEQCVRNNTQRKRKGYNEKAIREVYSKLSRDNGDKIDVTGKSVKQIYDIIKKHYF